jgi:hypothetical protein
VPEPLPRPGPGQPGAVAPEELNLLASVIGVPSPGQDLAVDPPEPAWGRFPGLDEGRLGSLGQDQENEHGGHEAASSGMLPLALASCVFRASMARPGRARSGHGNGAEIAAVWLRLGCSRAPLN